MIPVDAVMDGVEFRSPDYNVPVPVDFVAEGAGQTLVGFAGWWRADWITREGLELIPAELNAEPTPGHDAPAHWFFSDFEDTLLGPPGDADMAFRIRRTRRLMDTNRAEYLSALQTLKDTEEDFAFDEWVAAVLARPLVDPVDEFKRKHLGLRKLGRLFLLDQDNERVDVLLIDEHGNAATAGGNDWLEAFGDRWSDLDPRPDMGEFMEWAAQQEPYGPLTLSQPATLQNEGHIEDLAVAALR